MTFSRARAQGWVDDVDSIAAAEQNQIDTNASRGADMTAGGTYTPSSPVEVNGSGIKSDNIGDSTLQGTLALNVAVADAARVPTRYNDSFPGNTSLTLRGGAEDVYDIYEWTGTVTAGRTWTLSVAGAVDGEICRFVTNHSDAFAIDIASDGGAANPIATFPSGGSITGAASTMWVDLRYDSSAGEWKPCCGHIDVGGL